MNLTPSQQHYLKTAYSMAMDNGARVSDIASEMNVTKSSVCIAMNKLQENGLIYRGTNRLIFLTSTGKGYAIQALDKAGIIRKFLTDVMGVEDNVAAVDAHAMEPTISSGTLCTLCHSINRKCSPECHVIVDGKHK